MSVVINELEVVAAPEAPATSPGPARQPQVPAAALTPFEMRALLRHAADRADRGRAD
jgi:hypothetical protein